MSALAAEILTRVCLGCPERGPLPWTAFFAAKRWPDGSMRFPQSRCKECRRAPRAAAERRRHARVREDAEFLATRREYQRSWTRAKHGITPDRYRVTFAPSGTVPSGVVRGAVERSGMGASEIGRGAGLAEESVRRALGSRTMQLRTAERILAAVGSSPVEVGL